MGDSVVVAACVELGADSERRSFAASGLPTDKLDTALPGSSCYSNIPSGLSTLWVAVVTSNSSGCDSPSDYDRNMV